MENESFSKVTRPPAVANLNVESFRRSDANLTA
jgi:hypothetical protein